MKPKNFGLDFLAPMKKTKKGNRFERKVREIFTTLMRDSSGYRYEVMKYRERPLKGEIRIQIDRYGLNYDKLCQLSELLGTSDISIDGDYENGYYDSVDLFYELVARGVHF